MRGHSRNCTSGSEVLGEPVPPRCETCEDGGLVFSAPTPIDARPISEYLIDCPDCECDGWAFAGVSP